MLIQFTVKNFKSIRDEITLDMQPATISELKESLIVDTVDEETFLPVSVIYGPNGGGKSNVLKALGMLWRKVITPVLLSSLDYSDSHSSKPIVIEPFRFDPISKNSPTEFTIYFRINKSEYCYELYIQEENIVYESLQMQVIGKKRPMKLFTREEDSIITRYNSFKKLSIPNSLSSKMCALSYLMMTYDNNSVVKDLNTYFMGKLQYLDYGDINKNSFLYLPYLEKDNEIRKVFLEMLKEVDVSIDDYRIEHIDEHKYKIYTTHVIGEEKRELSLIEESNGTQKLFSILPIIISNLINGSTLLIDELDANLHPILLKYIIHLFTHKSINKFGAQLIFTSHDLSTMNKETFRRDEIWFVAKGNKQNSQLYALSDIKGESGAKVRNDAVYDKQYLEGKYGADPYLQKIIDWDDINE